jgi:hypothetical protein
MCSADGQYLEVGHASKSDVAKQQNIDSRNKDALGDAAARKMVYLCSYRDL